MDVILTDREVEQVAEHLDGWARVLRSSTGGRAAAALPKEEQRGVLLPLRCGSALGPQLVADHARALAAQIVSRLTVGHDLTDERARHKTLTNALLRAFNVKKVVTAAQRGNIERFMAELVLLDANEDADGPVRSGSAVFVPSQRTRPPERGIHPIRKPT